jgi:hypothetical protein
MDECPLLSNDMKKLTREYNAGGVFLRENKYCFLGQGLLSEIILVLRGLTNLFLLYSPTTNLSFPSFWCHTG